MLTRETRSDSQCHEGGTLHREAQRQARDYSSRFLVLDLTRKRAFRTHGKRPLAYPPNGNDREETSSAAYRPKSS